MKTLKMKTGGLQSSGVVRMQPHKSQGSNGNGPQPISLHRQERRGMNCPPDGPKFAGRLARRQRPSPKTCNQQTHSSWVFPTDQRMLFDHEDGTDATWKTVVGNQQEQALKNQGSLHAGAKMLWSWGAAVHDRATATATSLTHKYVSVRVALLLLCVPHPRQ